MENQMKNQNLYSILIPQVIITGVTICLHVWKFSRLFLNTGFRGAGRCGSVGRVLNILLKGTGSRLSLGTV